MLGLLLPLLLACQAAPAVPDSAADALVLKDGRLLLGQVRSLSRQAGGSVEFLVRRSWARSHFPDRIDAWERAAAVSSEPARRQRLDRLHAWRLELPPTNPPDPLASQIDAEIARLEGHPPLSTLLILRLPARDVLSLKRRPEPLPRLLRQGWLAGFDGVEELTPQRLSIGLADRHFSPNDPAPIDSLLPESPEPDSVWLARRAATEVLSDPSLRFIRYGDLILPETSNAPPNPQALLSSVLGSTLRQLLDNAASPTENPLDTLGRQLQARGRIGLVLTELEIAPSLDQVTVTSTLYARAPQGRWASAARRSSTVRASDAPPDAPLAADPQVQAVFSLLDALSPGFSSSPARSLSLQIGSSTRLALSRALDSLSSDLSSLSLPLSPPPPSD